MGSTHLTNCTVITCAPEGAATPAVVPSATLEIADGRVVSVGTTPPPEGSVVEDLQGRWVVPGLWDAHVHLGGLVPPYENGAKERDSRHQTARGILKAQDNLKHGITSLRSLGEKDGTDLLLRDLFRGTALVGPRIYASGDVKWSRLEAGVDTFRRRVREAVFSGVDQIKLLTTGGIPYPGPVTAPTMTFRELEAAIAEAHAWGRPVAVHAMGDANVRMAVECGADTVEHGFACSPDIAEVLVRDGLTFSPNLVVTDTWDRGSVCCQGLPDWMADNAESSRTGHHELFERVVELGGTVCAGVDNLPRTGPTDFGIERAGGTTGLIRELQLMRSLGLGPLETLRAATLNSATTTGVGDTTGSLEPGKVADLVVLDADPLLDVTNLEKVVEVRLAGSKAA